MESFKEFVIESIEHKDTATIPVDFISIINELSFNDKVRLAIFCAKDCFQLNTKSNLKKAKRIIELIEKWLVLGDKNKSLIEKQLYSLSDMSIIAPLHAAILSAMWAAKCVADRHNFPRNISHYALYSANNAAASFATESGTYDPSIVDKQMSTYRSVAILFLSETKFKHTELSKNLLKHSQDLVDIGALLDHLQEENEDIILPTENGGVKLNLPYGWEIEAPNIIELAEKISKSPPVIEYLKHLYT